MMTDIGIPDRSGNPLKYRAWALQERLLATRTVLFTTDEIVWECRKTYECECNRSFEGVSSSFSSTFYGIQTVEKGWQEVVQDYTWRSLTYIKDKLIALQGVAQRFQELHSGRYCFGLWEHHLVGDLLWSAVLYDSSPMPKSHQETYLDPVVKGVGSVSGKRREPSPQQSLGTVSLISPVLQQY
ncbi:HET-domain-containing protein [Ophiocordyceps camponoti-floridani]|uniref:HET-domain-containing protein n=1 Tax=Ophiocordyceps camponoti-floridani TaxID=2030778 RepID=A0A8H4QAU9_9HYPO|nr:HET-domain-containing protein [Ophiocordyceps camponoti-floridani]